MFRKKKGKSWNPIRILYCWRLTKSQREQFDINLMKLEEDLIKFRRGKLLYWCYARVVFAVGLFCNTLIFSKVFPILVFLGPMYSIGALITVTYIYKEEMKFIKNYDYGDCNPRILLKYWSAFKTTSIYTTAFGGISVGTIIMLDGLYEKFTGESAITQLGKRTGYHKDSPLRLKG